MSGAGTRAARPDEGAEAGVLISQRWLRDVPTKNKAAYSRIILLIKKCIHVYITAIYNKKDSVNTYMHV